MLFGSGNEAIAFSCYVNDSGATATSASTKFEGIVPNLERRYRETESRRCARSGESTSANAPAPPATGAPAAASARNVFVADRALAELVEKPIDGDAYAFFSS